MLALCERFGCLPDALLADENLPRLLAIEAVAEDELSRLQALAQVDLDDLDWPEGGEVDLE